MSNLPSMPIVIKSHGDFVMTETVYPLPQQTGPLDPWGVYNIAPIHAIIYFGRKTARAWRKSTRRWKKQQWMAYRNGHKEMQRLRNKAQGFPVFRCACCRKGFIGGLTVKEARAQYAEEFPGEEWSPNLPLVCADCFEDVGGQEQRDAWAARGEP